MHFRGQSSSLFPIFLACEDKGARPPSPLGVTLFLLATAVIVFKRLIS